MLTSRENTTRVPSGVHDGAWNGPVAPTALPAAAACRHRGDPDTPRRRRQDRAGTASRRARPRSRATPPSPRPLPRSASIRRTSRAPPAARSPAVARCSRRCGGRPATKRACQMPRWRASAAGHVRRRARPRRPRSSALRRTERAGAWSRDRSRTPNGGRPATTRAEVTGRMAGDVAHLPCPEIEQPDVRVAAPRRYERERRAVR